MIEGFDLTGPRAGTLLALAHDLEAEALAAGLALPADSARGFLAFASRSAPSAALATPEAVASAPLAWRTTHTTERSRQVQWTDISVVHAESSSEAVMVAPTPPPPDPGDRATEFVAEADLAVVPEASTALTGGLLGAFAIVMAARRRRLARLTCLTPARGRLD